MARGFSMNLYKADQHVCPGEVLHLFQPAITDAMNDELCRNFTDEEIGDALFQMGPLKAPGQMAFRQDFFNATGKHCGKISSKESGTFLIQG
jgi:hypothetical protein